MRLGALIRGVRGEQRVWLPSCHGERPSEVVHLLQKNWLLVKSLDHEHHQVIAFGLVMWPSLQHFAKVGSALARGCLVVVENPMHMTRLVLAEILEVSSTWEKTAVRGLAALQIITVPASVGLDQADVQTSKVGQMQTGAVVERTEYTVLAVGHGSVL